MSVAFSQNTTSKHAQKKRLAKSWTTMSIEQKTALDKLAEANHMSTAEFIRVVLLFAIEKNWRFEPSIPIQAA